MVCVVCYAEWYVNNTTEIICVITATQTVSIALWYSATGTFMNTVGDAENVLFYLFFCCLLQLI